MDNQYSEKVESYVRGEMTTEESKNFEALINSNNELAEEVSLVSAEYKFMQLLREEDIREKAMKWREETTEEQNNIVDLNQEKGKIVSFKRKRTFKYLALAASVLLIAGMFYFLQTSNETSNTTLASSFYSVPSEFLNVRNAPNNPVENPISKGIKAFNEKEYDEAIQEFGSISREDPTYSKGRYLLAHTYYNQQDFLNAIPLFEGLLSNTVRKDDAEWFLVLSYLNTEGFTSEADNLLTKISTNENHSFYQKARELKRQIMK